MKYKDILQTIGGLLVCVFIGLLVALIWHPNEMIIKLIGSVVVAVIAIYIFEKSAK